jgi:hypothetical protein
MGEIASSMLGKDRYIRFQTPVLIFTFGLLLRVVVILDESPLPNYSRHPYTDEIHYRQLADNLIEFRSFTACHQGFLTSSIRPPLYPAILSVFKFFTNSSPRSHHYLNLLLDSLNLLLIWVLASTLYGRLCAVLSTTIYAAFGPIFLYLTASTGEILAIFLLLLSVVSLIYLQKHRSAINVCSLAFCYSLLIHVRPAFILVLPIFGWLVYKTRSKHPQPNAINPGLAVMLIIVFCLPWGFRNYLHHNTIVPVCTVAGWHVGSHARSLDELPIDMLWNYIYDPMRKGYTEGDYYREATGESIGLMFSHPFETTFTGISRIIGAWGFEKPYIRFFLPRSYVYPIYLRQSFFLPMIDFEGICYITLALAVAFGLKNRRRLRSKIKLWWAKSWTIVAIVGFYVAVHTISIPMIQYRVIIEPLIIILFVGLIFHFAGMARRGGPRPYRVPDSLGQVNPKCPLEHLKHSSKPAERMYHQRNRDGFLVTASRVPVGAAIILTALFFFNYVFAYGGSRPVVSYSELLKESLPAKDETHLTYEELREIQWQNLGNIPGRPKARMAGVVRYISKGFQFPSSQIIAIKRSGYAASLFVRKYDPASPFGVGDIKLNFSRIGSHLREGDRIVVSGHASVDPFKEIVVDVEEYQILPKAL